MRLAALGDGAGRHADSLLRSLSVPTSARMAWRPRKQTAGFASAYGGSQPEHSGATLRMPCE